MSDVAHWICEYVYNEHVSVSVGGACLVSVRAEVPINYGGERLERHGRRCYPTWIELHADDVSLTPQEARVLAQRLIEAADVAQAIDDPDTDACGHWAPCEPCKSADAAPTDGRTEQV
jgi:hypothetical protein